MKFARYLEETQTPEWKKKYIDYRGLKKKISAIKQKRASPILSSSPPHAQESPIVQRSGTTDQASPPEPNTRNQRSPSISFPDTKSPRGERSTRAKPRRFSAATRPTPPAGRPGAYASPTSPFSLPPAHEVPEIMTLPPAARSFSEVVSASSISQEGPRDRATRPRLFSTLTNPMRRRSSIALPRPPKSPYRSYAELIATLRPLERAFFEYLEAEVEKAEQFYQEREKEALIRSSALKEQLKELAEHRRQYYAQRSAEQSTWIPFATGPVQAVGGILNAVTGHKRSESENPAQRPPDSPGNAQHTGIQRDPDRYHPAKKKLKEAILEFYKFLEHLDNFRILNLTAIRKAIKKFEKTTSLSTGELFNREKVDHLTMSNEKPIKSMIKDLEGFYASRFEQGDMKAARTRLRTQMRPKTHHFSIFRSGIMVGLTFPALLVGLHQVASRKYRDRNPIWLPLLIIYATLFIPTFFSLLVGANIIVWARSRINYPFIFELDLRTAIDSREYIELPAFLLMTLAYCFMLSFTDLLTNVIDSERWPLVWLVICTGTLFAPVRTFHWKSRTWLLINWRRLMFPGFTKVEFADFWMGDQFCSLAYSLSRLSYLVCVFALQWDLDVTHGTCNPSQHWIPGIVLSCLPSFVRLVQSVRRWMDSGLVVHLINGGKYFSSIMTYCIYYVWRHGGGDRNGVFICWVIFATISSIYTCSWDLLMDWSVLRPRAPRRFLREELIFEHYYPFYYFAIVTNVAIRFIWIAYIPLGGLNYDIRVFIAAMLEMFRRVQWNFIRVENEHLGNADRYRVTREVPLPYSFDEDQPDRDSDNEDESGLPGQGRRNRAHTFTGRSIRSRRSLGAEGREYTTSLKAAARSQDSFGTTSDHGQRPTSAHMASMEGGAINPNRAGSSTHVTKALAQGSIHIEKGDDDD